MTNTEKELSILFLGTAFLKMYMDSVIKNSKDIQKYEPVLKLLTKQGKMARVYSKKIPPLLEKATDLFELIEEEAKQIKPLKRFEKQVRFNEDKDVEVNGLVFAVSLILEHRNLKNRVLKLDYNLANNIYQDFEGIESKVVSNAKIMSKKFVERLI